MPRQKEDFEMKTINVLRRNLRNNGNTLKNQLQNEINENLGSQNFETESQDFEMKSGCGAK